MRHIDNTEAKNPTAENGRSGAPERSSRPSYEAPVIVSTNAPTGPDKAKLANACTSLNSITPDWEG